MLLRRRTGWPTWEWRRPYEELERMRRDLDRAFEDLSGRVFKAQIAGGGEGKVKDVVDPRGHDIDEATIVLSDKRLISGESPELTYEGPLPEGEHALGVRIRYDGGKTVDYSDIEKYLSDIFRRYREIVITRSRPRIIVQGNRARALETFGTRAKPINPETSSPIVLQGQVLVTLEKIDNAWHITSWGELR